MAENKLLERKIIELFKVDQNREKNMFNFKNNICEVVESGKPSKGGGGEPKTDLYIKALLIKNGKRTKNPIKIKISAKLKYSEEEEKNKKTGQFIENKLMEERFHQIFNKNSIEMIHNEFDNKIIKLMKENIKIKFQKEKISIPLG